MKKDFWLSNAHDKITDWLSGYITNKIVLCAQLRLCLPGLVIKDHRVENDQQFPHIGN
jgi:hypothetical protein